MVEKFTYEAGSTVGMQKEQHGEGAMLLIGGSAICPEAEYVVLPEEFGGLQVGVLEYVPAVRCPYPGCGMDHSMLLTDHVLVEKRRRLGVMACVLFKKFVWVMLAVAPRSPQPPYDNRPSNLLKKSDSHALWKVRYGSKNFWLITDYEGRMVEEHPAGFRRKKGALAAWNIYEKAENHKGENDG